jgi:hypothetical protein
LGSSATCGLPASKVAEVHYCEPQLIGWESRDITPLLPRVVGWQSDAIFFFDGLNKIIFLLKIEVMATSESCKRHDSDSEFYSELNGQIVFTI